MQNVNTLYSVDPQSAKILDTDGLREKFRVGDSFVDGEVRLTYTHYDRMIVGGAVPAGGALVLDKVSECGTISFLDRREVDILNIGNAGSVSTSNETWDLLKGDVLYLPMGAGPVTFAGDGRYYIVSTPAHRTFAASLVHIEEANQIKLGAPETANDRTIYQFIHPGGVKSCQLVMGYTKLHGGSVWNTMPAHTHDRRMEVYLYFDVADGQRVFHFMGQPQETRHLLMSNEDIAVSPPWSIHAGAGTSAYTFCWAMAGDNMDFNDMDIITMDELR